jgi:hypothetical protein
VWEVVARELTHDVEVVGDHDVDHATMDLAQGGDDAVVAARVERKGNGVAVGRQNVLVRVRVTVLTVLTGRNVIKQGEDAGESGPNGGQQVGDAVPGRRGRCDGDQPGFDFLRLHGA